MTSMITHRRLTRLLMGLALLCVPVVASAQTALTTTTTSAVITNPSDQVVSVTSATGITAPGTGTAFVYLLIDKELMGVRAINTTSLVASVSRGQNGTRATSHITGAAITVVPPPAIVNYMPSGQCVRTNLAYVPVIVGGNVDQAMNGTALDCLGTTTLGQWATTSTNFMQVLGATMASTAGTLGALTGTILTVSGTNAITGFTNPAGVQPGFTISITPSGVFTWTAAGNIALAGTAVVNKILQFVWNGSKWVPSYIA